MRAAMAHDYAAYMDKLQIDARHLESRRAFFELGADDLARLASLRPHAEKHADEVVEDLYALLLTHAESKALFTGPGQVGHVKRMQREYFLGLFAGTCDLAYVQNRLRVGGAHERVGIAPRWYIGAYSRYLRCLHRLLFRDFEPGAAAAAYSSVQKIVAFDMSLAIDTYIAANMDTVARHQQAIRELSTPVIRVHDRILLLPLVGAIDSHRAQQIMETLLVRVVDEQAKVVIVDIAGVAVVDTKVADHLIKTTGAVRLLGARTILTGISPLVARTMVQLGVEITSMQTCNRLSEGIELGLSLVGKKIVEGRGAAGGEA
jgi:rsbT co-antagonist protein RsbR